MHEALRGNAHESGGATSQLDLPSLMPLSVADCGGLQLGVLNSSMEFFFQDQTYILDIFLRRKAHQSLCSE